MKGITCLELDPQSNAALSLPIVLLRPGDRVAPTQGRYPALCEMRDSSAASAACAPGTSVGPSDCGRSSRGVFHTYAFHP